MPGRATRSSSAATSATQTRWDAGGAEGEVWAAGRPSGQLEERYWRSIAATLDLSDRQLQIVQSVFDGFDQEEISRELDISPHTVHTHLDRLYRKLHVKSRCELVVLVFLAYLSGRSQEGGPKLSAVERALPRR